jgi:hypothetical protein
MFVLIIPTILELSDNYLASYSILMLQTRAETHVELDEGFLYCCLIFRQIWNIPKNN